MYDNYDDYDKQEKDIIHKVMKLCLFLFIVCIVTFFAIGFMLVGEVKEPVIVYVNAPYKSDEAHGKNYKTVINDFQNSNFTDITYEEIDDLVFGWLTKDGEVEKVEINDSTEYTPEESYNQSEAHVVIYFHTFHHKEETTDVTEATTEVTEETTEATTEITETDIASDNIDEQQDHRITIDGNGYYHLLEEQIDKQYVNKKICIYGKITDEMHGDLYKGKRHSSYSYPYIKISGVKCYVKDLEFNEFMLDNNISWTNDEDVYATVYGTLDRYGLFGGLIGNADCIVLDNGNYYGDMSLYNKDEASKIISVTAEELLKLSENKDQAGTAGVAKEIYKEYNNRKCTVTGIVRDIQGNSVYIDSDDRGNNYVNADTTTVVYYVTDDTSKYSIGDPIEVTGTLKCYNYAIQILEE